MNAAFASSTLRPLSSTYARLEAVLAITVLGYFAAALLSLVGLGS